jgi:pathogenesis-related protein 1
MKPITTTARAASLIVALSVLAQACSDTGVVAPPEAVQEAAGDAPSVVDPGDEMGDSGVGPIDQDASVGDGGATRADAGAARTDAGRPPTPDMQPAAMAGMIEAHNAARANVSPKAATPIAPLAWSNADAAVATAYAAQCIYAHNPARGPRGENLFATTGTGTPAYAVKLWVDEKQNYNYANNSCSGVCGHYTQVVWSTSKTVGCAKQLCNKNSPFGNTRPWEIWVCDYSPAGNIIGRKPY